MAKLVPEADDPVVFADKDSENWPWENLTAKEMTVRGDGVVFLKEMV